MKRILYLILIAVAVFSSCKKEEEQATKLALEVVISSETLDMKVGETATLTARTLPTEVGQNVTWTVMDQDIATVETGVVTAVGPGVTYVVATSEDGAVNSSCLVSVSDVPDYEFILMDSNGNTITEVVAYPGYTTQIDVLTTDYQIHNYTWESSDPAVVQVTRNGQLTLKAVPSANPDYAYYGEAVIKVRADDGNGCLFKVVSNVSSSFIFGQEQKTFGTETDVKTNTTNYFELYYYNGVMNDVLPASVYTLTSTESDVQVSKVSNRWQLKTSGTAGKEAQVAFQLGESTPVDLVKVTTVQ